MNCLFILFLSFSLAKIYFKETFENKDKWIKSTASDKTLGEFELTSGKWYSDVNDKGLQTKENNKFYIAAAKFEEFSNADKTLVLQYNLKFEQNIDCGGGYVKLLPKSSISSEEKFTPDSTYNIMFGPDVCGSSKRTHFILNYKGKNNLIKKEIKCETDDISHLYTMILYPNNSYTVLIDNKEKQSGKLDEDWEVLEPKKIDDPNVSKPADWVDEKEIDDPEDKKPEGWDDIPKTIPDPDAKKPEEWDDEDDGEWEAPMVENPAYQGEWKPKRIPNPAYKGEWVHPQIDNPKYVYDPYIYKFDSFAYIGIDVWQVKAGTIYDDILITDSVEEAAEDAKRVLAKNEAEKKMREKIREEEKKKQEEEEAKRKAEEEEAKRKSEEEGNIENATSMPLEHPPEPKDISQKENEPPLGKNPEHNIGGNEMNITDEINTENISENVKNQQETNAKESNDQKNPKREGVCAGCETF